MIFVGDVVVKVVEVFFDLVVVYYMYIVEFEVYVLVCFIKCFKDMIGLVSVCVDFLVEFVDIGYMVCVGKVYVDFDFLCGVKRIYCV